MPLLHSRSPLTLTVYGYLPKCGSWTGPRRALPRDDSASRGEPALNRRELSAGRGRSWPAFQGPDATAPADKCRAVGICSGARFRKRTAPEKSAQREGFHAQMISKGAAHDRENDFRLRIGEEPAALSLLVCARSLSPALARIGRSVRGLAKRVSLSSLSPLHDDRPAPFSIRVPVSAKLPTCRCIAHRIFGFRSFTVRWSNR